MAPYEPYTSSKVPLSLEICTPSNTPLLGPTRLSLPKRHLDRFSRFDRAYERNQQTDTQRDRHTDTDHDTLYTHASE